MPTNHEKSGRVNVHGPVGTLFWTSGLQDQETVTLLYWATVCGISLGSPKKLITGGNKASDWGPFTFTESLAPSCPSLTPKVLDKPPETHLLFPIL